MRSVTAKVIGSVLGIGFLPFAPGTVASLAAALLYFFVPALEETRVMAPLIVVVLALGVWSGSMMEREYGKDPSSVVIDEVAGQWIALFALSRQPFVVLLSFVLFRVFDILKPGPVDRAQQLRNGYGVMADDVLAGLFANLTLRLLLFAAGLLP
jgi:phosphatidylglycerophosphatase A